MSRFKTLSHWLTNPHRLVVRSEEDFAIKRTLRFNYAKIIVLGGLAVALLCTLSFYASRRWVLYQTHADENAIQTRRQLAGLHATTDSLEAALQEYDSFVSGIRHVVYDDQSLLSEARRLEEEQVDVARAGVTVADLEEVSSVDRRWRASFEGDGRQGDATTQLRADGDGPAGIIFFPPVNGIISDDYDVDIGHYGVDVVAKKDAPIRCVADGTVIIASWTEDTGYTLAVQHANGLTSIYKHNASLSKKVGHVVKGGEVVATIGNTGELTSGPHLHFELWYDGNPVDPKEFVSF
ncbi:MAG: M23 family metallopeptidase [Catalinimonas sp.]